VAKQAPRWTEVTPSQFPHESEGLNLVRALLPESAPYRAWSNFEFRDSHGKWHEVDLLVLGQRRLHLVELKYYSGTLRGDDHRWLRDGRRAEDSPLKLARRKAQRLAGKLQDELLRWAQERGQQIADPRDVVPFVQESVFLHHPAFRCALPAASRIDLFGIDGAEVTSGLHGISERLLEPPTPQQSIGGNRDEIIAALLAQIGVVQRRQREVGTWVIDEEPLGDGEGWQDWPAFHRVATTDRARIRFFVNPPGSAAEDRARIRRISDHEYRIMSRLAHDGLLRPRDMVDGDLGVGLVYPADERFQRLDLWLADQANGVPVTDQLAILRQVAEAVGYAHSNRVVHRGLTPSAVSVRKLPDGKLRTLVGDWQSAGSAAGTALTGLAGTGVTALLSSADQIGSMSAISPVSVDADRRQIEAFQAPEGIWANEADRIRLDVFALGALAYYLLTGRPAASDRATLRERLHRDDGLDLAADLPQIPSAVRTLVLEATRPAVTERLADVRSFLTQLGAAERALTSDGDEAVDALEATPGSVLDGRFRLERRLGAGSTAVGLLVTDLAVGGEGPDAARVLKVALDDAAGFRLAAEAEVLTALKHPRLVRLIEGPIEVGGRRVLVLENAGDTTLGEALRGRARLSLDLLERWGTDLLEALVALDRAGIDHRDIKPANLGVREGRSDRVKHLVLFDFSLSRAGATALTAGTPPYLDPFLDTPGRGRYDSAAERYSASVVLFEMATGATPVYGDGQSDPASVRGEAAVSLGIFDSSIAPALVQFFHKALARDAGARHDTAADMLAAWHTMFTPLLRTVPDDADAQVEAAEPSTGLLDAGLSARALSALEPYGVATVADLVAIDPVRLNRLAGVAEPTRREVKDRARRWRERFAALVTGRGREHRPAGAGDTGLPEPSAAAELLLAHAGAARADARRTAARLVLGLDTNVDAVLDAFASQAELSAALVVTRARVSQHLSALQDAWAADPSCRDLLDALAGTARQTLADLGGVATVDELADAVLAALSPSDSPVNGAPPARIAAGLLRLALDRAQALGWSDADTPPMSTRRRSGRTALLAADPLLLDVAEALGRAADDLIERAQLAQEELVPSQRAGARLRDILNRATADAPPVALTDDGRLLRLGVALSQTAALSGGGDLHHRDLAPASALRLALQAAGAVDWITSQELRDRVRARFPALPPLPEPPRLGELVEAAGLDLVYEESGRTFRPRTKAADTTGLESRLVTRYFTAGAAAATEGKVGQRLVESIASRSFLALGVGATRADRAIEVLHSHYGARVLDLTQVLVDAMRAVAAEVGPSWDLVRAADAAAPGTKEAAGIAALVKRAMPAIRTAIEASDAESGDAPLLLTEVAPLARYDHLATLSRWTDLAYRRPQAVWLLAPQLLGNQGAVIDGRPLPLAAPGQFLRVDAEWLDAYAAIEPAVEGALR
jgi:serine/threonine protein kinase